MNQLFDRNRRKPDTRHPEEGRVIAIRGAREHNLASTSRSRADRLVVFTVCPVRAVLARLRHHYAEGQRRYVESLSAYARQFLEMMQKPDVDQIDGLSPAISIEQKTTSKNPRSTVGTVTEIYDYMPACGARIGVPYRPRPGFPSNSRPSARWSGDRILALPDGTRLYLLAPVVRGRRGRVPQGARRLSQEGLRARQSRRQVLRDRRGPPPSTKSSPTTSTSRSTASWCARISRRGSRIRWSRR